MTFLLPRPGVRVNLIDAVEDEQVDIKNVYDLNDRGDMTGWTYTAIGGQAFMLQRLGPGDESSLTSAASAREAVPVRRPTRAPFASEREFHERMVAALKGRIAIKNVQVPAP